MIPISEPLADNWKRSQSRLQRHPERFYEQISEIWFCVLVHRHVITLLLCVFQLVPMCAHGTVSLLPLDLHRLNISRIEP